MGDGDRLFLERVRAKTANQYEEGDEPVPETYEFNNVVKGQVLRHFRNCESGTEQYDVSFSLNGFQVETSVQMSYAQLEICEGGRIAAYQVLAKVISDRITNMLMKNQG